MYILGYVLVILGFFLMILTYGAVVQSKIKGRYVSGFPAIGGILIIIGFLLTSHKILCLLGLLDYGIWGLLFFAIPENIKVEQKQKNKPFPDILNGEQVLYFTKYNKNYQEIKIKEKNINAYRVQYVNYYAITKSEQGYKLAFCDRDFNIIQQTEFLSLKTENIKKTGIEWIKK